MHSATFQREAIDLWSILPSASCASVAVSARKSLSAAATTTESLLLRAELRSRISFLFTTRAPKQQGVAAALREVAVAGALFRGDGLARARRSAL